MNFPYGLVVRIRRSHRRGPGSIPGVGTLDIFRFRIFFSFFFFFFFSFIFLRQSNRDYHDPFYPDFSIIRTSHFFMNIN